MVNDIKKVKEVVRNILVENEEARENDDLLYLLVCQDTGLPVVFVRLGNVEVENLRGVGYWKLGLPFPQNWLLIGSNFNVVKK